MRQLKIARHGGIMASHISNDGQLFALRVKSKLIHSKKGGSTRFNRVQHDFSSPHTRWTGPAMSEIGLFDAMYSARALRRLKPDPVPDEIVRQILDAAIRAPSVGNSQHWAFVVVRDSEQRRKLG